MSAKSLIYILLAAFAALPGTGGSALAGDVKGREYWQGMIRRDSVRFDRTWTDGFVELMAIEPGMTVLDIGTGTGRYALAFAGLVGESGRVYATDIVPVLVELLEEEAREHGLSNLVPVLVTKEGVDEFYREQTYDLITLFHASVIHQGRVAYFRELREQLAEGGRLVITYQVRFPPFEVSDITDIDGLARELSAEPAGSPFRSGMRRSTLVTAAQAARGDPADPSLRAAVVEDFNAIVHDIHFGGSFADGMSVAGDLAFTPAEKAFADWLLLYVKSKGVYDGAELSFGDRKNASTLNRLLLVQRFRNNLSPTVVDPFGHGNHGREIAEKLEEADYHLEGIHDDVVPFEITLVFTAGAEGDENR